MAKPICMHCGAAATSTQELTFWGTTYLFKLCEAHADRLFHDIIAWTRIGEPKQDKGYFQPKVDLRSAEELEGSTYITASYVAPRRSRNVEPALAAAPQDLVSEFGRQLHDLAGQDLLPDWRLTRHAFEREAERVVSREDALMAAQFPDLIRPGDRPTTEVRMRGNTWVVVDPDTREIVSVAYREKEITHAA